MGVLTPKDFDVEASQETPPPKPSPFGSKKSDELVGIEGQGRPVGVKDKDERKKKEIKPRTSAELVEIMSWAETSQKSISDLVNPAFLDSLKKKSIRELSSDEFNSLEKTKFHILCNLEYLEKVEKKTISRIISSELSIDQEISRILSISIKKYVEKQNAHPNTETRRKIEASSVAIYFIGKE